MTADARPTARFPYESAAMAGFAAIALNLAAVEPGGSPLRAFVVAAATQLLPCYVVMVARRRRRRETKVGAALWIPPVLFVLTFVVEGLRGAAFGEGRPLELVLAAALGSLGLGLTALSDRAFFEKLAALVWLFLAIVASSIGGEGGAPVLAPLACYGAAAVAWLARNHGERVGRPPTPAGRRGFSIARVGLGVVLLAVPAAVGALGPGRAAMILAELMPTSGGTGENDPDARSGVGDGDNEVPASEDPQSVGFVDSDVFLETERPSLYDAFNESYGEPFKKIKHEKMIAVGPRDVGEERERPAENLKAGREFATQRRKPGETGGRPADRPAKALVYLKGPTPAHLPLVAYGRFDGATWTEDVESVRPLHADVETGGSWINVRDFFDSILSGPVDHKIKIGTLDSGALPMPSHVLRFRVGAVNRVDFFAWSHAGIVRMTDRTVPAGTVIDATSRTVDPERLRPIGFARRGNVASDPFVSYGPDYRADPAVEALAADWTRDVPHGWAQVEAVTAAIRSRCVLDRAATADANSRDVVADFLLRDRKGPDYLFATAAVVCLRSLGYPTRVVGGLYGAPEKYDPITKHTPITTAESHFWVEVRLPQGRWITVEPTPGFVVAPPSRSYVERLIRAMRAAGAWARRRAVALTIGALLLALVLRRRFELAEWVATRRLRFFPGSDPRRRVLATLSLLERRARRAGRGRPASVTPARWYGPIAATADPEPRDALSTLVGLADWARHAPDRAPAPHAADPESVGAACSRGLDHWTLARFLAPSRTGEISAS